MQTLISVTDVHELLDQMAEYGAMLPWDRHQVWGRLVATTRALQQALVPPPPAALPAASPSSEPDRFALPHALQMLWEHWQWLRPDGAPPPAVDIERPPNAALLQLQRAIALLTAEARLAGSVGEHLHHSLKEHLEAAVVGLDPRVECWDHFESRLAAATPRYERFTDPRAGVLVYKRKKTADSTLKYASAYSSLHEAVRKAMES